MLENTWLFQAPCLCLCNNEPPALTFPVGQKFLWGAKHAFALAVDVSVIELSERPNFPRNSTLGTSAVLP